jgi:hypothetical protein
MKAIQVKYLPVTNTKCARLQASTDEKINGRLVVAKSGDFFPEEIAAGEDQDQAQFLAEKFLITLGWDKEQRYRLVCSSFANAYYFTMILK